MPSPTEGYDYGWFAVSRRILDSSRWWLSPPTTFKVLMFCLAKATDPLNPEPGLVRLTARVIAGQCALEPAEAETALAELCREDPASRTREDKRTLEALDDGSGYRLVNFESYHPGVIAQRAEKAEARREKARHAAGVRWRKHREESATEADGPERPVESHAPVASSGAPAAAGLGTDHPSRSRGPEGLLTQPQRPFRASPTYETREAWEAACAEHARLARETALARQEAGLPESDPVEVAAAASRFMAGGQQSAAKINPAAMSHDRLALTLIDLRKMLAAAIEARDARRSSTSEPDPAAAARTEAAREAWERETEAKRQALRDAVGTCPHGRDDPAYCGDCARAWLRTKARATPEAPA